MFLALPLAAAAGALSACTSTDAPPPSITTLRPVPTGSPTPSIRPIPSIPPGARKGFGISLSRRIALEQLNSLDLSWFYNWGERYPAARPGPEFVPMVWGSGSLRRNAVERIQSEIQYSRATQLLGFNEPDHRAQANMSVDQAIDLWPQLEAAGLRLGSPAPVQALGDWLKEFMDKAAAKDLRVDFVAMHSYTPPNPDSLLKAVQSLHERYDKPVWITEFAVADWQAKASSPSRFSESEILTFMEETVAGLREMPFVERFAWKTRAHDDPIMGKSALFMKDGSLSPTGELYKSL
ncbi:glycosyl hydrolase [Arthrobacter sp. PAMC25284]|uniref:glycosyl hydrolase n=1 Tax=Arthrobacter sp. PAMC25284 TaxID=2861279 RepID=UPI001C62A828|nr:glycosyl hydrolase [Arthrobacter sp. PAMC25284]QYF91287.1 glycoside hydrolase family protein [Arthrobacter sp. PAMC25284]